MEQQEIMDKLYPKKLTIVENQEKSEYGWKIIEKHLYSEKRLSFGFGVPIKKTGYVYVLQHQVTGDIKFKKVILSKAQIVTEKTYVPRAQIE